MYATDAHPDHSIPGANETDQEMEDMVRASLLIVPAGEIIDGVAISLTT